MTSCRGQAYDGALNMSGIHNAVQALVKKNESKALISIVSLIAWIYFYKKMFNYKRYTKELVHLIKFSPKSLTSFEALKKGLVVSGVETVTSNLRTLCPTRWTVRHSAIMTILAFIPALTYGMHIRMKNFK